MSGQQDQARGSRGALYEVGVADAVPGPPRSLSRSSRIVRRGRLLAYTDVGLTRDDVVDIDGLASAFVTGVLQGDARYDAATCLC